MRVQYLQNALNAFWNLKKCGHENVIYLVSGKNDKINNWLRHSPPEIMEQQKQNISDVKSLRVENESYGNRELEINVTFLRNIYGGSVLQTFL